MDAQLSIGDAPGEVEESLVHSPSTSRRRSTILQASLDLLSSYERSHLFFQSNFPSSSPSIFRSPAFIAAEVVNEAGSGWVQGEDASTVGSAEDVVAGGQVEEEADFWTETLALGLEDASTERRSRVRPKRATPRRGSGSTYLGGSSGARERYQEIGVARNYQIQGSAIEDSETSSLLPKRSPRSIEEKVEEYHGRSTFGQTLFNCLNLFIGLALLSERG